MGILTAGGGTRNKSHFIEIAGRGKSDKIAQTRQEISQVSRDLPPLNALRVFEVAARLESISRAADELHVTHGAVGRQIRVLEETLGDVLFSRHGGGLELTQLGPRMYDAAAAASDPRRTKRADPRRPATSGW